MSSIYSGNFQLTGSLSATDGETASISANAPFTLAANLDSTGNGTISAQPQNESLNFVYMYQGQTQVGTVTFQIPALTNVAVTNGVFSTFVQVPSSNPAVQLGITISGTFSADQRTVQENFSAVISGSSQGVIFSGQIQGPGGFALNPAAILISGEIANQATLDTVAVTPFQSVTITDPNPETSQTLTITLQDSISGNGATNGTLTNLGGGSYNATTGVYTLTGTTAQVTAALHALVFNPTVHQHSGGQVVTTGFKIGLTDNDSGTGSSTVVSVKATQTGPVPTTLVTFNGPNGDWPVHKLVMDAAGDVFGVTNLGGPNNYGNVFEVAKTANGYASTATVLLNATTQDEFTTGVIVDADGNLIGTNGTTLYEIAKTANGYAGSPTTLVTFPSSVNAGVTADANGNLFGMMQSIYYPYPSTGVQIFEVPKTAGGYASAPTIVAQFQYDVNAYPANELLIDTSGNLFGTIKNSYDTAASIFEVTKTAGGYSDPVVIANLSGLGYIPLGPLVEDKAGDLFGQTSQNIFEIVKTASGYNSTPVTLAGNSTDYGGGLIIDAHGDLFGSTFSGGPYGNGDVFEIVNGASGYASAPTILFAFDTIAGIHPKTGLTVDAAGNLFTTTSGGSLSNGSVIELQNTGYQIVSGTIVTGTAGNDVLQGTPNDDNFDGGGGSDTVSYSNATAGVTVNLSISGRQNTLGAGNDQLVNIENLTGSAYNDILTGDAGPNVLSGGSGDDVLRGDGDTNTLDGGAGVDTAAYALAPGDYLVTANSNGSYTVEGPNPASHGAVVTDTLTSIENASFDETGQTLTMAQFAADSFNALNYIASYGDLIKAFGANPAAGLAHFMQFGFYENRNPASFNPLIYIAAYPDLIKAFGDNQQAAAQHYINSGYYENRSTAGFSPLQYIASYPDLIVAFGDNQTAALEHYIKFGYYEGRYPAGFGALEYIASNPDLIPTLGDNQTAALEQYIQQGYFQGRFPASFNALEYVASNPDLIPTLGDNTVAIQEQYILHGYAEGRPTSGFNALQYIASYPDLIAAFGDNQTAALEHYINNGIHENRTASFDISEYLASNPDLALTYGSNMQAGLEYYILQGHLQNRATDTFDPVAYLLSYPDLENASLTASTAILHYLNSGVHEGRSPSGAFGTEQTQHVLAIGTAVTETIGTAGDEDWFSVNLGTSQNYSIGVAGLDSGSGTLADPILQIRNQYGQLLDTENAGGVGRDAAATIANSVAGLYYITVASNVQPGTGTYKILVLQT